MDNYSLWEAHDYEQERKLQKLPKCAICGEPIQQERAVKLFGDYYCDNCLNESREWIDD